MDRANHYESAFEAYLRDRRIGYVAVDESRRTSIDDDPIKSLDFIVYSPEGPRFLVDIKGRRFPGGTPEKPRKVWQNWVSREDIVCLERWENSFGDGFRGLIVFLYQLSEAVELAEDTADLWEWKGSRYLVRAVAAGDYRRHMRVRSPRWGTVCLPTEAFRELVRPFRSFTHPEAE